MIEIRHARALSDQFARPPVAGGAGSDAALAAYREPVPIPPVIKINLAEVPENHRSLARSKTATWST